VAIDIAAQSAETEKWARHFWAVTDNKDVALLADLVHPDCEFHDVRYAPVIGTVDATKWGNDLFEGMPDSKRSKIIQVATTGRVCIGEFEYEGTHTGTYYGFPATGNFVRWMCVIIYKFNDDGQLIYMKNYNDTDGLESQLKPGGQIAQR
jgi:SnoaL-like polyketide cyclase